MRKAIVTVHSVSSNTLRDAPIWSILPHIALAATGFSCVIACNRFCCQTIS